MKYQSIHTFSLLLLLTFLTISCTEPYALQTNTFEEALVIEATITNELKNQEIKISKTYRFEENGPTFETGAIVSVTDDLGNEYSFQEINGSYFSINAFQAVNNRNYELHITTGDGKKYTSNQQKLTTINELESITPVVFTDLDGNTGIQIRANSYDPTNSSKYYRYDYEETYKVVSPKWIPIKAEVVPDDGIQGHPFLEFSPRTYEARTCFSTNKSTDLLLTSTNLIAEDRVSNFPIRFIKKTDFILSQRYSILVKQYIQSLESYTYYKTLSDINGTEDGLLSQVQPGFFYGNIKPLSDRNEKVIGFFEVSSVSSKRIFFNFNDLFPNDQAPPFFNECIEQEFPYCFLPSPAYCKGPYVNGLVTSNILVFYSNIGLMYTMVETPCGDCTYFASNIRPSFWID